MVQNEAERIDHAGADLVRRKIRPLVADAQRSQAKTSGGDAGNAPFVGSAVGQGAVPHQPRARSRLVPEKQKGAADDLLQKFLAGELPIRRYRLG